MPLYPFQVPSNSDPSKENISSDRYVVIISFPA